MTVYPEYIENLIKELRSLPGIGPKSAARMAFHILDLPFENAEKLSSAITEMKKRVMFCTQCGGISDGHLCSVCSDESRDRSLICVVEEARDILTIEKCREYSGLYHVLGGTISPLNGIGPDELNIDSFIRRCEKGIAEVIIATNPTIEGDATTLYLARILKSMNIRVMRIARGLPVGSNLEFADSATIARSFAGRINV